MDSFENDNSVSQSTYYPVFRTDEEGIEEAGESIKGDVEIIEEDVKEELEH